MRLRYIETTGRCNLKCPFCVDRFRNYDMTDYDFEKIVERNESLYKNQWLWVDFNGEPLIDKHIYDRIALLNRHGANTQLSTNGILLDTMNCKKIIESGLKYIVISVLSLNKEIYLKLRGEDLLDRVIDNTKKLKELVDSSGSDLVVQAVATDVYGNDIDSFVDFFHGIGWDVAVHKYTTRAGDVDNDVKYCVPNIPQRQECLGLEENLIVLSNCEVVCCCSDYRGRNSLGNLRDYDYSIAELMENKKLEQLVEMQKKGKYIGACKQCKDWIYYQAQSQEIYVKEYPFSFGEV